MKKSLGMLAGLLLLVGGVSAKADPMFVGNLTVDHCTNGCGVGHDSTIFGTVTLTDTAAGVDFQIDVSQRLVSSISMEMGG